LSYVAVIFVKVKS